MVYEVTTVGEYDNGANDRGYKTFFNTWINSKLIGSNYYYGTPRGDTITFNRDIAATWNIPYFLNINTPAPKQPNTPLTTTDIIEIGKYEADKNPKVIFLIIGAIVLIWLMGR